MTDLNSRPARSGRRLTASLSTSIPDYLYEALKKKADEERRSLADMTRMILEDALEAPRGD